MELLSLLWNSGWEADATVKSRNSGAIYLNPKRTMCVILVFVDTNYQLH
jgi:hypothetical protein